MCTTCTCVCGCRRTCRGVCFLSRGRWGIQRRCCICLCSLRGPCLRPAARTPHRPRPNAGSHCWRHSRNSDQRPEQWRWLLPVTHRGQMHPRLEHTSNTLKHHRHLEESSGKHKTFFKTTQNTGEGFLFRDEIVDCMAPASFQPGVSWYGEIS